MNILEKFNLQGKDTTFYYMLLSRLKTDCEYYLGSGGRYHGHLWTGDEYEQARLMRAVWRLLPEKPEWLTKEQLDGYIRRMLDFWGDRITDKKEA